MADVIGLATIDITARRALVGVFGGKTERPRCGDSRGCVGAAQRAGSIEDPANGSHQTMALQDGPHHVAVRRVCGEIDWFGGTNSDPAVNRNVDQAL